MPIYEYNCHHCDTDFEKLMSFSDTRTPICPVCASADVERQLGRPAIHFKGSGWYITDSKSSSKESANGGKNGKENGTDTAKSDTADTGEKSTSESKETSTSSTPAPKAEKTMAAD